MRGACQAAPNSLRDIPSFLKQQRLLLRTGCLVTSVSIRYLPYLPRVKCFLFHKNSLITNMEHLKKEKQIIPGKMSYDFLRPVYKVCYQPASKTNRLQPVVIIGQVQAV